jgi:hypothetical protein
MLTDEERLRVYGSADAVAAADRRIAEAVDGWPPLTVAQKTRLRALLKPAAGAPVIPHQRRRVEPRNAKAA